MRYASLLAAFAVLTSPLAAQAAEYHPTNANPRGWELVAVFIGSTHCVGNSYPGFLASVDSLNRSLFARATAKGIPFVAVGVATDWDADSGYAYLKSLSRFDELIVGRNWFNLGIAHYVLATPSRDPLEPQVLLFERFTSLGTDRPSVTEERLLAQFRGAAAIVTWVGQGTPLP